MPTIFRDPVKVVNLDTGEEMDLQTFNIRVDLLDGWNDTAGVDAAFTPRGGGDGSRSVGAWLTKEKYLIMGGMVFQLSRALVEETRDALWRIFQPENRLAIDRTVVGAARRMFVRVYDIISSDDAVEEGFRFSVPLVALDPAKYSAVMSTVEAGAFFGDEWYRLYSGVSPFMRQYYAPTYRIYEQPVPGLRPTAATVINDGNMRSSRVRIIVHGPLIAGDWSLVNETTEQSQIIDVAVGQDQTLIVDSYEEATTLNGVDYTSLTYGDWLRLDPGVNTLRLVTGTSNDDAYMTVESYSSWR